MPEPTEKKPYLEKFLMSAAQEGASDVHLNPGRKPRKRINGTFQEFDTPYIIKHEHLNSFAKGILGDSRYNTFIANGNLDFSLVIGEQRYRGNLGICRDGVHSAGIYATFRVIPDKIIDVREIGFPFDVWEDIIKLREGLVLVTGVTGSGKSTTLASMLQEINRTQSKKIITLEDPVEYLHKSVLSEIVQRELGVDVKSFSDGVKASLRQDPDIIFVGEIRDRDTEHYAVEAAETGHLVFSTLHTKSAEDSVERLVSLCNPNERDSMMSSIASNLACVLSQQLIPYQRGVGRTLAMEVMNVRDCPAIQNLIRSKEAYKIHSQLEIRRDLKMIPMDTRLKELYIINKISYDDALKHAHKPLELEKELKKIKKE